MHRLSRCSVRSAAARYRLDHQLKHQAEVNLRSKLAVSWTLSRIGLMEAALSLSLSDTERFRICASATRRPEGEDRGRRSCVRSGVGPKAESAWCLETVVDTPTESEKPDSGRENGPAADVKGPRVCGNEACVAKVNGAVCGWYDAAGREGLTEGVGVKVNRGNGLVLSGGGRSVKGGAGSGRVGSTWSPTSNCDRISFTTAVRCSSCNIIAVNDGWLAVGCVGCAVEIPTISKQSDAELCEAIEIDRTTRFSAVATQLTETPPSTTPVLPTNHSSQTLLRIRHTCAHVMAMAVQKIYPQAKVTIGPWIDNGFYYDFDVEPLTDHDLKKIKKEMDRIIGPHLESTGNINRKAVELESVAGAYWRGDITKPMLQRVYGTAWENGEQLKAYLHFKEEAKRRDHRRIGQDLDLFSIQVPQL
ncbi:hypothetical protein SASPL_116171 [Salvia splendens]|uniref:Threonyl/alanyl tRNA synthetase SAD domain-containing protein n=1 Tax=Salvia splendens TaxID=180675 RepID=A0A8X8XVV0_SALSN|nr:hypothetical protein SASPL_116171 [Salvia splendens]